MAQGGMTMTNSMTLRFAANSRNESFARSVAGAFAAQLDPTMGELSDVKTAVSEAVTNAIVHGYGCDDSRYVTMEMRLDGNEVTVEVEDEGKGIDDVAKAREPFYTTAPDEERSGMGFSVMEIFMDELSVESEPGRGTRVTMSKRFGEEEP